jgi:hypothetical protein
LTPYEIEQFKIEMRREPNRQSSILGSEYGLRQLSSTFAVDKCRTGFLHKRLAGQCWANLTCAPLKQLYTKRFFQFANLSAQGRLRDMEFFSRLSKAKLFGNHDNVLEQSQFYRRMHTHNVSSTPPKLEVLAVRERVSQFNALA